MSQTILMAMDRAPSVRMRDANGYLHVEVSNISKANVCPYYGREIPAEGLDPDRIYYLYRDPEELARAAPTFNNIPLLSEHVPVIPEDGLPEQLIIGSTGTDVEFDGTYLRNSLVVWQQAAQDGIEAERKRELSCGYRYRADMTPGVSEDGLRYDGVMRDIIGNHVALVIEGRAGPDVVVGDELMKLKSRTALLASGAIQATVRPLLAADAKVDLSSVLSGVDAKTFAPAKLAAKVLELVQPKLAADASLDAATLTAALSAVQPIALDEDKIDDEDKQAEDEDSEEDDDGKGDAEDEGGDDDDDKDDKPAMDAATVRKMIADAEKRGAQHQAAIEVAKKAVAPFVGEVVGMDSADAIYKLALDNAGVDLTGVHKSAYKAMVAMMKAPGEQALALDAAPTFGTSKLAQIIPNLPPVMRS